MIFLFAIYLKQTVIPLLPCFSLVIAIVPQLPQLTAEYFATHSATKYDEAGEMRSHFYRFD